MPCTAPALREPSYTSAHSLADPRFQGQWWILGLALTSMLFNYILGEGLRFDLNTKASPEQVLRALTDFTDARLQIWNRTLDPKTTSSATAVRPGPLRGKAVLDRRSGLSFVMTGPTRSRSAGQSWTVAMGEAVRAWSR